LLSGGIFPFIEDEEKRQNTPKMREYLNKNPHTFWVKHQVLNKIPENRFTDESK